MSKKDIHDSDCATHNEPAYPNGDCDCRLQKTSDKLTNIICNHDGDVSLGWSEADEKIMTGVIEEIKKLEAELAELKDGLDVAHQVGIEPGKEIAKKTVLVLTEREEA